MIGRLPYLTIHNIQGQHITITSVPHLTPSCLTCLTFSFQVTSILRMWWRLEACPVSTLSWSSPSWRHIIMCHNLVSLFLIKCNYHLQCQTLGGQHSQSTHPGKKSEQNPLNHNNSLNSTFITQYCYYYCIYRLRFFTKQNLSCQHFRCQVTIHVWSKVKNKINLI